MKEAPEKLENNLVEIPSQHLQSPPISSESKGTKSFLNRAASMTGSALLEIVGTNIVNNNVIEKGDSEPPLLTILPIDTDCTRIKRFIRSYGFNRTPNKARTVMIKIKPKSSQFSKPITAVEYYLVDDPSCRLDSCDYSQKGLASTDGIQSEKYNQDVSGNYLKRSKRSRSSDECYENNRSFRPRAGREFHSIQQFLEEGTVQDIHNSLMTEIPDFESTFNRISSNEIDFVLKSFSSEESSLKDRSGLELVDEKEIPVIKALKITPKVYTDTKRRFFAEKARRLYKYKTFRKTDAQKACKIDVNKVSKMYEIFQKLGLLNDNMSGEAAGSNRG